MRLILRGLTKPDLSVRECENSMAAWNQEYCTGNETPRAEITNNINTHFRDGVVKGRRLRGSIKF